MRVHHSLFPSFVPLYTILLLSGVIISVIVVVLDVDASVDKVCDEHLYVNRQQAEDGVEVVVDFGDEDYDGPSSHLADDLFGSPLNRYHIQKTCQKYRGDS